MGLRGLKEVMTGAEFPEKREGIGQASSGLKRPGIGTRLERVHATVTQLRESTRHRKTEKTINLLA